MHECLYLVMVACDIDDRTSLMRHIAHLVPIVPDVLFYDRYFARASQALSIKDAAADHNDTAEVNTKNHAT